MRKYIVILFALLCADMSAQVDSVEYYAAKAAACMADGDGLGARDNFKRAYVAAEENMEYERMVMAINLSSVLIDLAEYAEAYSYISAAEKFADSYPSLVDDLDYQKAGLFAAVGDNAAALDMLEPLTRRLSPDSHLYVPSVRSLLDTYILDGRHEKAVHKADTLMSIVTSREDSLYVSRLMVRAFALMGKEEDARRHLKVSDELYEALPAEMLLKAQQERLHGEVDEIFGEYETAYAAYERAREHLASVLGEGHPECVSLLYGMAKTYLLSGDVKRAWRYYSDYLSQKMDYLSGEMFRMNTWEMQSYWNRSNEGLVDAGLFCHDVEVSGANLSDALNAVMFAKSVSFDTSVGFGELVGKAGDPALLDDYRRLKELNMRRSQALRVSRPLSDAIKSEAEALEAEMRRKLSACGLIRDDMTYPDWRNVADRMDENAVAVEFVDFKAGDVWQYSAFIYRKGCKAPVYVPLCTEDEILERTVTAYLYGDYRVSDEVYDAAFETLYDLLWTPLEQYFREGDTICFSPSGLLHNFPIEYLESDGRMFAERYPQVRRMMVTKDIPYVKPVSGIDRVEAFGEVDYYTMARSRFSSLDFRYLEHTAAEMLYLEEAYMGEPVVFNQHKMDNATETDFKDMDIPVSGNAVIHLSTHGFYLSAEDASYYPYYADMDSRMLDIYPLLRCGLAMAGANLAWRGLRVSDGDDDGILTAQEISEMDMRGVSLVVLSACQTGLGDLGRDGVQGFQRAFRLAGADNLMVSLWPVDDFWTMQLMTQFYGNMVVGMDAHSALLDAVRWLKSEGLSPYFYAPYVIVS